MPTKHDYETARALALESLSKLDIDTCCTNAGISVELVSPGIKHVRIPYIGHTYTLTVHDDTISFDDAPGPLKIPDQVLLLHYLITASSVPVAEEWITFREVPSGSFYYAAFVKRAITPLQNCFGERPALLGDIAQVIGQVSPSPGDTALKIFALSRVPIVLSLWRGDEEFPPEANVYFDKSIPSYLSTEDIAYLSGAVVYKVIGIARQLSVDSVQGSSKQHDLQKNRRPKVL
jgi:hypothetical protein